MDWSGLVWAPGLLRSVAYRGIQCRGPGAVVQLRKLISAHMEEGQNQSSVL